MTEPGRGLLNACNVRNGGQRWTAQHENLDPERARRGNLTVGCVPPAVLADDRVDAMGEQQLALGAFRERATRNQITRVWHAKRRLDRIDTAYEIMVLRRRRERREFLAAECEKDVARFGSECPHGVRHIGDFGPTIACRLLPGRPSQRKQPHPGSSGGTCRVLRNRGGGRVRCIDQRSDAFGSHIGSETFGTAEAADPDRHRLRSRGGGTAGKRERDRHVGAPAQAFREPACFERTAEDEDAVHGVR